MKYTYLLCLSWCTLLLNFTIANSPTAKKLDLASYVTNCTPYIVIDLSKGPNATSYPVRELSTEPITGWIDLYKTNRLVLRHIEASSFVMGSPDDELGRSAGEDLHNVTLTKPYYIGVFKLTQRQWELVMGRKPSLLKGGMRPVENISYNMIRGASKGAQWPASTEVDPTSFIGILRAKTSLNFDLPTEAQWEYACRAGTSTALNSNQNLLGSGFCPNLTKLGRYGYNQSDGKGGYLSGHTTVGSYIPNAWGIYDMHGNSAEWCLDWYTPSLGADSVIDPVGASSGTMRVLRGGRDYYAPNCRAASRGGALPFKTSYQNGMRLILLCE